MKKRTEAQKKAINERARQKYRERRDQGICVRCGRRWADAGRSMCRVCAGYVKAVEERVDPDNSRHRAWFNQRTEARKAAGQCIDCNRAAQDGFSRCAACRRRRAEYQQVRRLKDKLGWSTKRCRG